MIGGIATLFRSAARQLTGVFKPIVAGVATGFEATVGGWLLRVVRPLTDEKGRKIHTPIAAFG